MWTDQFGLISLVVTAITIIGAVAGLVVLIRTRGWRVAAAPDELQVTIVDPVETITVRGANNDVFIEEVVSELARLQTEHAEAPSRRSSDVMESKMNVPTDGEANQHPWWQRSLWWAAAAVLLAGVLILSVIGAVISRQIVSRGQAWAVLLELFTPALALLAGFVAVLNYRETRQQNERAFEVVRRRGRSAERLTIAIDQLGQSGSDKVDLRIGAVYALEQIARDSPELRWSVMEVLTAFLREHSGELLQPAAESDSEDEESVENRSYEPRRAPADLLAIANVLRRHHATFGPTEWTDTEGRQRELLSLAGTDLRAANLSGANLEGFYFVGAQLQEANFRWAQLQGAVFQDAHLQEAKFGGAQLRQADFQSADLHSVYFRAAQLQDAVFEEAHLEGADFRKAQLQGAAFGAAHLEDAIFEEAHLEGADFRGAQLQGADLRGVDLSQATGLSQDQLNSALRDERTKLPSETDQAAAPTGVEELMAALQRSVEESVDVARMTRRKLLAALVLSDEDRERLSRLSDEEWLEVRLLMLEGQKQGEPERAGEQQQPQGRGRQASRRRRGGRSPEGADKPSNDEEQRRGEGPSREVGGVS